MSCDCEEAARTRERWAEEYREKAREDFQEALAAENEDERERLFALGKYASDQASRYVAEAAQIREQCRRRSETSRPRTSPPAAPADKSSEDDSQPVLGCVILAGIA